MSALPGTENALSRLQPEAAPPAERSREPIRRAHASAAIRVCHVMSADLWAGAEVQLATLAGYLVRRPDVMLVAALFNEGPLATELSRMGVPVTVINERRLSKPRMVEALTRMFRTHAIDIVHTHRYNDTAIGALAAALAGVPFLLRTVHGRPEPMRGWASWRFRAYNTLDRALLQWFADGMVAVSSGVAKSLEPLGGRYAQVVRLPNGIDLDRVKPARARHDVRKALGIAPDTPLIGTVGRLCPVKGQAHFLEAARRVLAAQPRAHFLIVGDGELRNHLTARAVGLGLDGHCRFTGARADVYDLISAMDVFVLPSLDEGTPMALLEAMALGVPVVASAVGGIPDVITDRTTGLLVPAANASALAEACLWLLGNGSQAETFANRARRVVAAEFSHATNGERLVDLYRSVMARGMAGTLRSRVRERFVARDRRRTTRARDIVGPAVQVMASARRRVETAVGRRRAELARQDPAGPRARLRTATHILVVCHGNIIRSAFAARLMAQTLGPERGITIASAGLEAIPGRPSPPAPILAADHFRVDLRGHTASPVTADAVTLADLIFVMDVPQLIAMRRRFPSARSKTFLLTCLAADTPLEVRDPVSGGEDLCRASFDHIVRALRPVLDELIRH
jgi:glycosyltransferase involved in cell wall biosynthesis/protein-tyrosine-phosphatase